MQQPVPPSPPSSADGFIRQPTAVMNPSIDASHPRGTISPEQGCIAYHQSSRYSTPVRDDDFSTYEPSTVYSQKSDVSFATYSGGRGLTSHPYGPLPDEVGYATHLPYTPEASPPTPCPGNDSITTRSGLSIPKKAVPSKSSVVKSGRVQKRSRAEKAKCSSGILSKPLSEIAKDLPDTPVADIATFVARSTDERLKETSRNKKAGQIKRPMNAFMLYRKAYQEVAKLQGAQNNHQHVSKVCGAGWPLEPPHIKEMFDQWAKTERWNHQQAHPGYKFTPSKPRKTRHDEEGDGGYSDNDSEWTSRQGLSMGARRSRARDVSRLSETPSITYDTVGNMLEDPSTAAYHGMYAYPTPGRSHAHPYGPAEPTLYNLGMRQYHGVTVGHEAGSRTPSPGLDYQLDGMDGFANPYGPSPELTFNNATAPSMFGEASYDVYGGLAGDIPLGHDSWLPHMGVSGMEPMMTGYEDTAVQDAYLKGTDDDWKVEEIEEPSQFDHWFGQTEEGLV
ncbi:hypothetical protein ACJ41O_002988 [Fusarium nematophilum]